MIIWIAIAVVAFVVGFYEAERMELVALLMITIFMIMSIMMRDLC